MKQYGKYNGYVIEAKPQQVVKDGQWAVDLSIVKHRGGSVANRIVYSTDTYPSREEATTHCFVYNINIIDGRVEGGSVVSL